MQPLSRRNAETTTQQQKDMANKVMMPDGTEKYLVRVAFGQIAAHLEDEGMLTECVDTNGDYTDPDSREAMKLYIDPSSGDTFSVHFSYFDTEAEATAFERGINIALGYDNAVIVDQEFA